MTATADRVREILAWLERQGSKRNREGMARYAITSPKVFGVSVSTPTAGQTPWARSRFGHGTLEDRLVRSTHVVRAP